MEKQSKMEETKAKIKTDLNVRSYKFALAILKFIDTLDKKDFNVQIIARQLLRSGTNIGANIIEAIVASSRKDFINFYLHALKSANETKFWLSLLVDSGKTDLITVKDLLSEASELANILGASIVSLKKNS